MRSTFASLVVGFPVEVPQPAGDFFNVAIRQALNPSMRASQPVLIKGEHRNVRVRAKLLL